MNRIKRAVTLSDFILFLSYMASGQPVFAPVQGAKWTYSFHTYSRSLSGFTRKSQNIIKAQYLKDTILGTLDYKLILLNYETLSSSYWPVSVIGSIVTWDSLVNQYSAYQKKLFIRQSQDTIFALTDIKASEEDRCYYTFLQSPGSYFLCRPSNKFVPSPKVIVDSIRVRQIGPIELKVWYGKSFTVTDGGSDILYYYSRNLTFVERIGPIDDILLYFAFTGGDNINNHDESSPLGLICYEDSEIGVVKFMNLDCDLKLVSTDEVFKDEAIQSHYNPYSRSIEIRIQPGQVNQWQFSLVHVSGQVILTTSVSDFNNFISVPQNLPDGIYFARIANRATGQSVAHKYFISN